MNLKYLTLFAYFPFVFNQQNVSPVNLNAEMGCAYRKFDAVMDISIVTIQRMRLIAVNTPTYILAYHLLFAINVARVSGFVIISYSLL